MNHKSSVYLRCTLLAAPHVNPVHTKRRRFTFSETVLGQLKYNQDGRTVFRLVVRKERYMHMFIRIIHYSRAVQIIIYSSKGLHCVLNKDQRLFYVRILLFYKTFFPRHTSISILPIIAKMNNAKRMLSAQKCVTT